MDDPQLVSLLRERPRVLVLGDLMLDHYVWGDTGRVSQEAPILILRADREEYRLGGAANVAHMLAALETEVTVLGVTGADRGGQQLRSLLQAQDVDTQGLLSDHDRCTTIKQRFVGRASGRHTGQILRVDHETTDALSVELEAALVQEIAERVHKYDVLLISDYAKGVCTERVLAGAIEACRDAGVQVLADPARHGSYASYAGATLLKPNRHEAAQATGSPIRNLQEARTAAEHLCHRLGLETVVITLDRDGMLMVSRNGDCEHAPAQVRDVYDITGAGDMAFAALGLGVASQLAPYETLCLANVASGWQVQREGVVAMSRAELDQELESRQPIMGQNVLPVDDLAHKLEALRAQGKRIVFTNGCFDLLHVGHVAYLQEAARLGDILVVATNSDRSVRNLKGPARPVIAEQDRAAMLVALECVDFVTIFDDATPCAMLRTLRPDVLVKGGTYRVDEVVGHEIVRGYGGQVCVTGAIDGVSTSHIVESVRQQPVRKRAG